MSAAGAGLEIRVVSNAELRAGPVGDDTEPALAGMTASKQAALLANPLLGPDDEPARVVAFLEGRVVGQLDLVAGEISTPHGVVPSFWGSAFHVSADARGQGIGGQLLRAAEELREGAGACAPSRLSYPLYLRRGYLDIPLRRHLLVRRTGPLAERWLGKGRLARAASALGDTALRGLGSTRPRSSGDSQLEPCAAFPPELEPRLPEGRAPFAMHRSAAWLDWIVRESFGDPSQRRALYLVRSGGGETVGYLLVKARVYSGVTRWQVENLHLGSLVDWQIFEPGALSFEQLVVLATGAVEDWGVDAVEACVPPGEGHARFRRLGFLPLGVQHVVVRGREGSVLATEAARDIGQWTVRPAEGDHAFS
ncbi:MAG TPA: GNAT family N-acetyltransferase [Gaiellaceae bacterium]|nr:GNAT family N-acetyltransferase [Gaiellaceae bacterium]